MSRFIILGGDEFTLGFRLAGIKDIIGVNENTAEKEIKKLLDEKVEGILVIDNKTVGFLPERLRHRVEDSVNPVVVVLSDTAEQETIRRMIIKAIGIDILEKQ